MQKKNNKETMKRVLKYIRKYTPALVLSLLLAGLTVLLTLYIPILTGNAVDLIIGEGTGRYGRYLCHYEKNRYRQ